MANLAYKLDLGQDHKAPKSGIFSSESLGVADIQETGRVVEEIEKRGTRSSCGSMLAGLQLGYVVSCCCVWLYCAWTIFNALVADIPRTDLTQT